MMLCSKDAIEVVGEDVDKNHLREIGKTADYEALNNLYLKREVADNSRPMRFQKKIAKDN